MDKNTLTGFILIGAILAGFWFLNKPTADRLAKEKAYQDSIAAVNQQKMVEQQQPLQDAAELTRAGQKLVTDSATYADQLVKEFGEYAPFAQGEEKEYVLENDKVKLTISNKGARITSVNLKEYENYEYKPLYLFDEKDSRFDFHFFTDSRREIGTSEMFFNTDANPVLNASNGKKSISFSMLIEDYKGFEITYSLEPGSYRPRILIDGKKLQNALSRTDNSIYLNWDLNMVQLEKGVDFERRYSGLYYQHSDQSVESIKGGKEDTKEFATRMKWIGFKDQFFSSVLIADDYFGSAELSQQKPVKDGYISIYKSELSVPVNTDSIKMSFYFGPNHYQTLNKFGKGEGLQMQKLISLGWPPVKYVNQIIVIPVFNILNNFIGNYGLIILILTIFIKLIIFPFTYRSYISTAKMRVLKPQIDEATAKYGPDKQMEKQQATMAIYRKAGVNPMGGCLPMLFQFPILVAMFYFFPSSIELRHESFLWAKDLASYDAILTWEGNLPLIGNLLGNHLSLFTILMSITNLIYTMVNQEMTASTQQMKGMKTMMYMMPLMFFFMFNKYAAGLSYYYFISTLITIGQTFLMRRFVNENVLLAKLEENKKKTPKKKSGFAKRIEDMQKQQQQMMREQAKKRK